MMFKPVKPKLISDQVFEQLRDLIYRGYLKPGDRLMTERELAQELGVSRPTVRDALHKLVAMDLVEHRQGQGTFVSSPAAKKEKKSLFIPTTKKSPVDVIAIGASTGGPPALQSILSSFDKPLPVAIVVSQHMPPGFTVWSDPSGHPGKVRKTWRSGRPEIGTRSFP